VLLETHHQLYYFWDKYGIMDLIDPYMEQLAWNF